MFLLPGVWVEEGHCGAQPHHCGTLSEQTFVKSLRFEDSFFTTLYPIKVSPAKPTGVPGENQMESRWWGLTSSFVLSLVSLACRGSVCRGLAPAPRTVVPSVKGCATPQLRQLHAEALRTHVSARWRVAGRVRRRCARHCYLERE